MVDYISREAAIALTDQHCFESCYDAEWMEEALKDIPAADVRPVVRGEWKKAFADHEAFGVRPFYRYCSKCNEVTVHQYNFCPNCGADMKGENK